MDAFPRKFVLFFCCRSACVCRNLLSSPGAQPAIFGPVFFQPAHYDYTGYRHLACARLYRHRSAGQRSLRQQLGRFGGHGVRAHQGGPEPSAGIKPGRHRPDRLVLSGPALAAGSYRPRVLSAPAARLPIRTRSMGRSSWNTFLRAERSGWVRTTSMEPSARTCWAEERRAILNRTCVATDPRRSVSTTTRLRRQRSSAATSI